MNIVSNDGQSLRDRSLRSRQNVVSNTLSRLCLISEEMRGGDTKTFSLVSVCERPFRSVPKLARGKRERERHHPSSIHLFFFFPSAIDPSPSSAAFVSTTSSSPSPPRFRQKRKKEPPWPDSAPSHSPLITLMYFWREGDQNDRRTKK